MAEEDKTKYERAFYDVLIDELAKKLHERGFKTEIKSQELIIKSGNIPVGLALIGDIETAEKRLKDGIQIYLIVEKRKEKELVSKIMAKGLFGKIKFISWEMKFYGF